MSNPYLCPNCKTNRTRFNIMEQVPVSVKLDPGTGNLVHQYSEEESLDPFHLPYNGSSRLVQCAACGVTGEEEMFIKRAQSKPL
ncbi:DNA alkylation repair protein [Fictibacillus aquaticus]|uniref:DNA alkylation repair protein n=1 Tax=Fictibacillus aquaticus TaxID=2021314 RepID=A0A235FCE7_9BACL|nr:DNA alkylation repair protein [Fictibacillus aquaticus]OYD58704.1 DNA alkylation repair protein [Fictibacillus aquaticus]